MNEAHFREIEVVLLYVSSARKRAEKAARELERAAGDSQLVAALREAESELFDLHRKLMQGTYFAVPENQLTLT